MRKFVGLCGVMILGALAAMPAAAQQTTPSFEFATLGYYVRTYLPSISSSNGSVESAFPAGAAAYYGGYTGTQDVFQGDSFNQYGFGVQVAGNVNDIFGVVGEYAYYAGTPFEDQNFSIKTTGHFYGGGPRLSYRGHDVVTPSVDFLIGGYTLKVKAEQDGQEIGSDSETGFAYKVGGNLDFRVNDWLSIRAPGVHFVRVHVANEAFNNVKISFGFNFTAGERE